MSRMVLCKSPRQCALSMVSVLLAVWLYGDWARCGSATERGTTVQRETILDWQRLPDLPNELGVAGPYVGVHDDTLIVAGGANFPSPVWETEKVWRDRIHVLLRTAGGYVWRNGGTLSRPVAYGAAVSTPDGVVCMGGNDGDSTFREVFVLRWDAVQQQVVRAEYPPLPRACAFGQAALIGSVVYLAGGQSEHGLDSAMNNFWMLDLSQRDDPNKFKWRSLEAWPGEPRAFNITATQHNGYDDCVYVISGRRQDGVDVEFLTDVWEFTPRNNQWRRRHDAPRCVMAGTGIGIGQSHILVLGGADGSMFSRADELRDTHPGFPLESLSLSYDHRYLDLGRSPAE